MGRESGASVGVQDGVSGVGRPCGVGLPRGRSIAAVLRVHASACRGRTEEVGFLCFAIGRHELLLVA